ncbi:hypothetical protein [Streptomyces sp. NPDC088915]
MGFALHGRRPSHFAHLTSYEEFLAAFGTPDRVHEDERIDRAIAHGCGSV